MINYTEQIEQILKSNDSYLRIKVIPKSAKNEITDIMEGPDGPTVKIRIKAAPEKGKANQELIKFLAKELDTPKDSIRIISGKTDQLKLLKITP